MAAEVLRVEHLQAWPGVLDSDGGRKSQLRGHHLGPQAGEGGGQRGNKCDRNVGSNRGRPTLPFIARVQGAACDRMASQLRTFFTAAMTMKCLPGRPLRSLRQVGNEIGLSVRAGMAIAAMRSRLTGA